MASRPIVTCSPLASSISISRGSGLGETAWASSISPSVVLPMAETTTTSRWPGAADSAARRATFLIMSGSATDEPPYFWTISWPMRGPSYMSGGGTVKRVAALAAAPRDRPGATGGSAGPTTGPALAARPVLVALLLREALAESLARLLPLLGRHLPPAVGVVLEALALRRRHGLVMLEALHDLLLPLRPQLLA